MTNHLFSPFARLGVVTLEMKRSAETRAQKARMGASVGFRGLQELSDSKEREAAHGFFRTGPHVLLDTPPLCVFCSDM